MNAETRRAVFVVLYVVPVGVLLFLSAVSHAVVRVVNMKLETAKQRYFMVSDARSRLQDKLSLGSAYNEAQRQLAAATPSEGEVQLRGYLPQAAGEAGFDLRRTGVAAVECSWMPSGWKAAQFPFEGNGDYLQGERFFNAVLSKWPMVRVDNLTIHSDGATLGWRGNLRYISPK